MPGVFRDIELTYKGEKFTFSPTIRIMRNIEQTEQISLSKMVLDATEGRFPMFEIALVYAAMLRAAGCKRAHEDDVFMEMSKSADQPEGAFNLYLQTIIQAISPPEMDEKKADAPAEVEG